MDYRAKRRELGLTQEEVAEMVGIETRTLQYIESGACSPKLEQWYALISILNQENDGRYFYTWNPNRLRTLRKEKKLTQAELAKKIGVSMTSVMMWERDFKHSVPTVENLQKLCLVFQKSVDNFLIKEEKETLVNMVSA